LVETKLRKLKVCKLALYDDCLDSDEHDYLGLDSDEDYEKGTFTDTHINEFLADIWLSSFTLLLLTDEIKNAAQSYKIN